MTGTRTRADSRSSGWAPNTAPRGSPETFWSRIIGASGLVFIALMIGFGASTSNMPAATDSRQDVFSYLARHHDRLQVAAALYGLAMVAALLFLAGLFTALRKAEERPGLAVGALAGGILAASATVTGALVLGTTANRYADIGAAGARTYLTLFLLSIGATVLGEALMIGCTAAVSVRARMFPRWFAALSGGLAIVSVAGAVTIGFTATAIQVVAGVAVLLDAVWIAVTSLLLWRRPELTS